MTAIRGVPLLDLTRMAPELEDELREAFERVLKSGRYVLGPEVEALERACAEYVGARHAIGVSSGTDALIVALMAIGVGPGDEVLCPAYTFYATAGSVWRLRATPVFVDILPATYNCDPDDAVRKLTPRTKAMIPVHLFGECAEMDPILEAAASREVPVIEDAAQAIGAQYRGRRAGSMGRIGCFSFFPSKNLGCLGDGGLVTTNDDDLAELLRALRVHGGRPKYYHHFVGGNFRLDALQAAFLLPKLRRLDAATERRQKNAALYTRLFQEAGIATSSAPPGELEPFLSLPAVTQTRHIFNQYVIRVHGGGRRDALREFLAARNIGTEIYYPVPMHLQPCFASLGYREGDLPVSEAAARETLALPVFSELREEEIRYVVKAVADWCHSSARGTMSSR